MKKMGKIWEVLIKSMKLNINLENVKINKFININNI